MRFNNLDLNLLVALDALLTERNVTRAAAQLHLSQSAMSNALGRLREHLQDDLLVPVGRTLELTPRAQILQEAVRDLLVRIEASISAQPAFDCTQSDREFTILCSDYTMTLLAPHVLAIVTRLGGTVRFRFSPQAASPARALERGEADLLVIPNAFCSTEHPTELLLTESYMCAAWNRSTHAQVGLSFEQYASAGHVALPMPMPDTGQPPYEAWFVQRFGLSRRITAYCYSFTAMLHMLVGTELIATVHTRLARRLLPALPLVLLPVPFPLPELEQVMQWHRHRATDPGLMWLRQLMAQAAMELKTDPSLNDPQGQP